MVIDEDAGFKELNFIDLVEKGLMKNVEKVYLSGKGEKIPVLFSGSVMNDVHGNKNCPKH